LFFAIEQRFIALDKLIRAAQSKGLDEQTASYFCKLGSVLICGNLERCVELIMTERIASKSPPQVSSFLKAYFKRGTNYDCEQIGNLLYRFDSAWGREFEEFVEKNGAVKEGISSCYAIRNSVAHGGGQSLGPRALVQYYEASFTLVAQLEHVMR
jgi:RiboL-PSP-HEPN